MHLQPVVHLSGPVLGALKAANLHAPDVLLIFSPAEDPGPKSRCHCRVATRLGDTESEAFIYVGHASRRVLQPGGRGGGGRGGGLSLSLSCHTLSL